MKEQHSIKDNMRTIAFVVVLMFIFAGVVGLVCEWNRQDDHRHKLINDLKQAGFVITNEDIFGMHFDIWGVNKDFIVSSVTNTYPQAVLTVVNGEVYRSGYEGLIMHVNTNQSLLDTK